MNDEWYTPREYIGKARRVLGHIGLDPASCLQANYTVQASLFYDQRDNGLKKPWAGNVWLNPPYSRGLINKFVDKFIREPFDRGIILVNASTDTSWFQRLLACDYPVCFTAGRISFIDRTGKPKRGNSRGQAFFFKNCNSVAVHEAFSDVGELR